MALSPDGRVAAVGTTDREVQLWDMQQGTLLFKQRADVGTRASDRPAQVGDGVWSIAFSPDGSRLATGTDDGLIQMWGLGH